MDLIDLQVHQSFPDHVQLENQNAESFPNSSPGFVPSQINSRLPDYPSPNGLGIPQIKGRFPDEHPLFRTRPNINLAMSEFSRLT